MRIPTVLLIANALLSSAALAQSAAPTMFYDFGAGLQLLLPDEFEGDLCGPMAGLEAHGGLGRRLTPGLTVEVGLSAAASAAQPCEAADLITPPHDGPFRTLVFPDGTAGEPYLTSAVRLGFDPTPEERFGARFLVGGGRFWGKGLWFWSAGMGLRFGLDSLVEAIEVERRDFTLTFAEKIQTFEQGVVVGEIKTPMERPESMWMVRFRVLVGY